MLAEHLVDVDLGQHELLHHLAGESRHAAASRRRHSLQALGLGKQLGAERVDDDILELVLLAPQTDQPVEVLGIGIQLLADGLHPRQPLGIPDGLDPAGDSRLRAVATLQPGLARLFAAGGRKLADIAAKRQEFAVDIARDADHLHALRVVVHAVLDVLEREIGGTGTHHGEHQHAGEAQRDLGADLAVGEQAAEPGRSGRRRSRGSRRHGGGILGGLWRSGTRGTGATAAPGPFCVDLAGNPPNFVWAAGRPDASPAVTAGAAVADAGQRAGIAVPPVPARRNPAHRARGLGETVSGIPQGSSGRRPSPALRAQPH